MTLGPKTRKIVPMHDRVLVKPLDDPEYLHSSRIALIRVDPTLVHQAGVDPLGEPGDYRREMIRFKVVEVGPGRLGDGGRRIPMGVQKGDVVYATMWDDAEGLFPGMAMIREADIGLIQNKGA